jgi:hypothetical protein
MSFPWGILIGEAEKLESEAVVSVVDDGGLLRMQLVSMQRSMQRSMQIVVGPMTRELGQKLDRISDPSI